MFRHTSLQLCGLCLALALRAAPTYALCKTGGIKSLGSSASAASAAAVIGTTSQEIQANFPSIIERNFSAGNANQVIRHLSSKELADLAALYARSRGGDASPLLAILARKVDAAGLQRVASAFGEQATLSAVRCTRRPR